jgi:hypothetical protein
METVMKKGVSIGKWMSFLEISPSSTHSQLPKTTLFTLKDSVFLFPHIQRNEDSKYYV